MATTERQEVQTMARGGESSFLKGNLEPGQVRSDKRLKQKLIVPLTETEVMARWRRKTD